MAFLEVNDLSFSFDNKKIILNRLSLKLEKGSLTALLGPNGCGKTCLLNNIIGFHKQLTGKILIDNQDIYTLSYTEKGQLISYVPQFIVSNIDYSVFDFILLGRAPYIKSWNHPTKKDEEFVIFNASKLGLIDLLDKGINKLSGGELQLACIARSLTQESPLILMDEPTSALDFGNQAKLFRILNDLSKEGKTILFTTHNPNHVKIQNCDVAIMNKGKIINQGYYKDVLTESILSDIYNENVSITNEGFFNLVV